MVDMNKRVLLAFLFFGQVAIAQTQTLTKVPGTKCSLVPPIGFEKSTRFSGFQNVELGASIMINELPAPYKTLVDGFTKDALKSRGMDLKSKQSIDFNGSQATFIILAQSANGTPYTKQILIFGSSDVTVLVNGMYPESASEMENEIKDALLSTVYNPSEDENALDAASFTIDVNGSEFKLIKYISGGLIYSTDGKIPTEKPILIVSNSVAKVAIQNQEQFAVQRLKDLPQGDLSVIKEKREISIDNLKGIEIVAHGRTKEGLPELVYQVIIFNNQGDYYLIVGQSRDDFPGYLESYRKIAKTFKRK